MQGFSWQVPRQTVGQRVRHPASVLLASYHRTLRQPVCGLQPGLLGRGYVLYSGIAVVTTSLNWLLVQRLATPHHLAWLACISTTGATNLFALKRLVFSQRAEGDRV